MVDPGSDFSRGPASNKLGRLWRRPPSASWARPAPWASASSSSWPIIPGSRWPKSRPRTARRARRYAEACTWRLPGAPPRPSRASRSRPRRGKFSSKLLFSGLDSSVAGEVEEALAGKGHAVVSNSRNHRIGSRRSPPDPRGQPRPSRRAIEVQRKRTGGGYIVTNPNCSVVGLAMALAPLASRLRDRASRGGHAPGPLRRRLSGRRRRWTSPTTWSPTSAAARKRRSRPSRGRSWAPSRKGPFRAAPFPSRRRSTAWPWPTATPWPSSCASASGRPRPKRLATLDELPGRAAGARAAHRPPEAHPRARPPNDRPQPRLDRDREGGMAVSRGPRPRRRAVRPEARGPRPQHDPRRGRRRHPERRAAPGPRPLCPERDRGRIVR